MSMKTITAVKVTALAAALTATSAAQATLFLGGWDDGKVYSVDLTTETVTELASGFSLISGMEGIGNDLFVYEQSSEDVTQVDPTTGAKTLIGTLASDVVDGEGTFAMRPDRTGFTSDSSGSVGTYFSFDLTGGTTTNIGTGISFDGVDFAPGGVLYGLTQAASTAGGAELHIIDPVTGTTTLIGSTGITDGGLAGLVVADGDFIAGIGQNLYRIDPTDGSATFLFDPGIGNISGAAFLGSTDPVVDAPEPGSLALLGLGLAGLGFSRRRRR